jgi:hypothetical protein
LVLVPKKKKSLLHNGLKQVMSLFTLGSARAALVVALVCSFPDVFNVIMALISPYNKQLLTFPVIFLILVLVPKKKTLPIVIKM